MAYKNCLKCNRQYMNRRDFVRLTGFVGIQKLDRNKHNNNALELRNCSCGSTLAHAWQLNPGRSLKKLRRIL